VIHIDYRTVYLWFSLCSWRGWEIVAKTDLRQANESKKRISSTVRLVDFRRIPGLENLQTLNGVDSIRYPRHLLPDTVQSRS